MKSLDNRIEAFTIEVRKDLIDMSEKMDSSIHRDKKTNPLEDLSAKLNETQLLVKELPKKLTDYTNKRLEDFKLEIMNVSEPEKSNAIDKLRNSLVKELHDIVLPILQQRIRQ